MLPDSAGVPVGDVGDLTAEARIRRAAMGLFAQRGYEGTSTRAIAAAAGVSAGLVLHYFVSKEGLRERVDNDVVATIDRLFSAMAPEDAPVDFDAWRRGFRSLFTDEPNLSAYLRRSFVEQTTSDNELLEKVFDFAEFFLTRFVERGVARPLNDLPAVSALLATMSMTSVLFGEHLDRRLGGAEPIEERLARAEIDVMQRGVFAVDEAEATISVIE